MTDNLIKILKGGIVDNDVVIIQNFLFNNQPEIELLNSNDCITEIHDVNGNLTYYEDLNLDLTINLKLSLYRLMKIGFYETFSDFVSNNKSECPIDYYIHEIDIYSDSRNDSNKINNYYAVVSFIKFLKEISNYTTENAGLETIYIIREKSNLLAITIDYSSEEIEQIDTYIENIKYVANSFVGQGIEKGMFLILINELVIFLTDIEEPDRFKYLIKNFSSYYTKSLNSYEYYLRDFTYNKFKIELDSAILNYTQKIRTVINEAQTKLIAIPVAFVLASANLDFTNIFIIKNFVTLASLFIFSILIEIFIKNQLSSLIMIETDVEGYKNTFNSKNNLNSEVIESFGKIIIELKTQKNRIRIIRWITWGIPISITVVFIIIIIVLFHKCESTSGTQLICWYNTLKNCL